MLKRTMILLVLVALPACSRGVAVESEPGPIYTLVVENPMPHAMDVAYDDGTAERPLGTVPQHASREFVVSAPARQRVEIVARDAARTHTVRKQATLEAGRAIRVALTP